MLFISAPFFCMFMPELSESHKISVRSHFPPAFMLLLFIPLSPSDCRGELGCMWHRYCWGSPMQPGPRGWGWFTGCEPLSQATTLKSTAHNPTRQIQWRLSNLSSFMHERSSCPSAGRGETLVPPHSNLRGIIPFELFIVHDCDIF